MILLKVDPAKIEAINSTLTNKKAPVIEYQEDFFVNTDIYEDKRNWPEFTEYLEACVPVEVEKADLVKYLEEKWAKIN